MDVIRHLLKFSLETSMKSCNFATKKAEVKDLRNRVLVRFILPYVLKNLLPCLFYSVGFV